MATLDFESDQFLKLLTDALRAGPGSPEWHQAVTALQAQPDRSDAAREHRLLVAARQHLESGKAYRAVRAGPEFTRRLLNAIEQEPPPSRSPLNATAIALVSAGMALVVLVLMAYWLIGRAAPPNIEAEALAATVMTTTLAGTEFDEPVLSDWRRIGALPLESRRGLRPGPLPEDAAAPLGGGIVLGTPVPPDQPFAVETSVRSGRAGDGLVAQVVVTDRPDFRDDNATGSHELVWLLQQHEAKLVLPNGRLAAQSGRLGNLGEGLPVRIVIGRETAIVDVANQRLWSGSHDLASDKPRYVMLRFIRKPGDKTDTMAFRSVRVTTR